jgi:putative ABC transport system permease protein
MKTRTLLYLAWKNLWLHRLRALLTISGVTLGVGAIVFLVSIGFGLERLVTSQVANFDAFTTVDVPAANLKTGKINDQAIERLQGIPHIERVDEVVDLAGRARLDSQKSTTETVAVGVDSHYFSLAQIGLRDGRVYGEKATKEVVINESLAGLLGFSEKPGAALGKHLVLDLIIPEDLRARDQAEGPLVKTGIPFTVVGIATGADSPTLFLPLAAAEAQGAIHRTSLKIKVDRRESVPQVRKSIENAGFSTEYIGDTVDQIAQVFSLFRVILGAFGLIALLVAALGTFNTLTISLMERIREVGLFKTLGMRQRDIFRLFLAESVTIGAIGGLLGLIGASLTGWVINALLHALATQSGADVVSIYYTPWPFILASAVGSLVVGFITGFYPAHRAIKMNALDVLRYQ